MFIHWHNKRMSAEIQGVIWMISASFWFSLMTVLIRHLSSHVHPLLAVFFRCFFALVIMLPWVLRNGRKMWETHHFRFHFYRSFTGLIGMATWFMALALIPAPDAVALSFTVPLFTSLLAVFFLREKMGLHRIAALIIGFCGMLVVLRPGENVISTGALLAMSAVFTWSLSNILIKKMSRHDSPETLVFYFSLLMVPFSLPFAIIYWQDLTLEQWAVLFLLGYTSNQAQYSVAMAYTKAEVTLLLPIDFSRLIFVSIMAWLAFDEAPDIWTVLGSVIIFGSAVYITHREARARKKSRNVI